MTSVDTHQLTDKETTMSTHQPMPVTGWPLHDDITNQLNDYDGPNIWEDVIYHLPGFDGAATDAVNRGDSDDFVAGGVHYWHDGQQWRR